MWRRFCVLTPAAAPLVVGACGGDPTAPGLTARVVSVVPSGGATGVDPNAPIVVTFSHAMQSGMMGGGNMMGSGWRHPNGTYGMVFTFTTVVSEGSFTVPSPRRDARPG